MISPVLVFLGAILLLLAKITARIEKWNSYSKAIYFTFITALTVGYGNTVPNSGLGRFLSVVSAFVGVVLTGVIVSVALNSVMLSWQSTHDTPMESSIQSALQNVENEAFHASGQPFSQSDSLSDSLALVSDSLAGGASTGSH